MAQDIGGIAKNTTPAVDANTNRFSSTDFAYDANGNIIEDIDEITSLPREFIFNGDNKQTEVKRDGVTIGRYYYDGEGRRVKKVTDTETTVFVYAAGQLIAEYSTAISQTPSVSYTTADHLGSPRVITNELGQVSSRRDFMPYGEEIARSAYGSDTVRQKFTGYRRDGETGLDDAKARLYKNTLGRFTVADEFDSVSSGLSGRNHFIYNAQPQNWNKYAYTRNNPLNFIDYSGHFPIGAAILAYVKQRLPAIAARATAGTIINGGAEAIRQYVGGEERNWRKIGAAAAGGASGGVASGLLPRGAADWGGVGGGIGNATSGIVERALDGDDSTISLDRAEIGGGLPVRCDRGHCCTSNH